ncbi:MAG: hypothetical protein IMW89_12560 [Ktedonobacteraceae bacterium]|nr:hypothetical protein [Ktedonobacteraceae bacterium]
MNDSRISGIPSALENRPSDEVRASERSGRLRILERWHSLAAPPEPPADARILQREAYRRARSLSAILFFFLPSMILVFPSSLFIPNYYVRYVVLSMVAACILSLLFNRKGKVLIAGIILTLGFEVALTTVILTTTPLDETGLQLYDLYILVELLAIAVLPLRGVWIITIGNSLFVLGDLAYQPRTETFTHLLAGGQFIAIVTRPIALFLIVAAAITLWIVSITKATRQAYHAEFIANLERATAMQNEVEVQEKRELEESIQQIIQVHTDAINHQIIGRIPYPPARVLWPLVGVINTLWTRLQRSQQISSELTQLQQDIFSYNEYLQNIVQHPEQPIPPYRTKTVLLPLIHSVESLHRELLEHLKRNGEQRQNW